MIVRQGRDPGEQWNRRLAWVLVVVSVAVVITCGVLWLQHRMTLPLFAVQVLALVAGAVCLHRLWHGWPE